MALGDSSNILGFTSAIALADLVGREKILQDIEDDIFERDKRIVFLIGEGGIGKSRILAKLIEEWNAEDWPRKEKAEVADKLVDFYLTNNHLPGHLAYALYQVSDFFTHEELEKEQKKIDNFWIARIGGESEKLRTDQLKRFDDLLTDANSKGKKVIFFFDTAEKLVYEWPEELQEKNSPWAEAWDWLLGLVKKHNNLRLVVAGRPAANKLYESSEAELGKDKVSRIKVERFTNKEMNEYLEAVQKELEKAPDKYGRLLRKLKGFTYEEKKLLFQLSEGIPIRLSLMLDYLLSPAEIDDLKKLRGGEWENLLHDKLAANHPQLYEILIAMGRLRKGTNAPLLATVMEIEEEKAEKHLNEIEKYSFIKTVNVPGAGQRYFLHDELYRILDRTYYNQEDKTDRRDVMKAILNQYYEVELERVNQEIQNQINPILSRNINQKSDLDTNKLVGLSIRRHTLQVESAYYGLQGDHIEGEQRIYRYLHDSAISGDIALDYALEAELLAFLGQDNLESNEDEQNFRERVKGMLAIRPVVRKWILGQFDSVVEKATELRNEEPVSQIFNNCHLNMALLNVWEAYARIYRAQAKDTPKKIKDLLDQAIKLAEPHLSSEVPGESWCAQAVQAFAYRVRAYYWTKQERFKDAAKDYKKALTLWEKVTLRAEVATTLNDGGYTRALIGRTYLGRIQVQKALEKRQKIAALGPLGLSINTLALIRLLMGAYEGAITEARQALHIFKSINYPRGIGLSNLALSEARRLQLELDSWKESVTDLIEHLEDIDKDTDQAVSRLKESDDIPYYIKALIEQGCVWRDATKYCMNKNNLYPCQNENIEEYKRKSKELLERARTKSEEANLIISEVASLANMAWLGYYSNDEKLTKWAKNEVKELFEKREDIPITFAKDPLITPKNGHLGELWEQLGKLYMALGSWQYRMYEKELKDSNGAELTEKQKETIVEMGRLFTLSLQYSQVRGSHYAKFMRAQTFLYEKLSSLLKNKLFYENFLDGISKATLNYQDTALWSFLVEWELTY